MDVFAAIEVDETGSTPAAPYEPIILSMDATLSPPAYRRAERASIPLMLLSGLGGFFCGAILIGYLWYASGQAATPERRNDPKALLAAKPAPLKDVPVTIVVSKKLAPADLAFGEQQVERMVKDRPEMLRYVKKDDAVWTYCARAFAGEAIGQRVYWDSANPDIPDVDAEHYGPDGGDPGYVRVRKAHSSGYENGIALTCEQLWSCAVYELENIRGSQGFDVLLDRAFKGELTREQWVRENARLEYLAGVRTAKLYETIWLPLAKARGIRTSPSEWYVGGPATFEEDIAQYDDPNSWPWNCWGKYWDDEIQPTLDRKKKL